MQDDQPLGVDVELSGGGRPSGSSHRRLGVMATNIAMIGTVVWALIEHQMGSGATQTASPDTTTTVLFSTTEVARQ